jgi:hypothetical protein
MKLCSDVKISNLSTKGEEFLLTEAVTLITSYGTELGK